MYLTRIELALQDRAARECLPDIYRMHAAIMPAFDHAPKEKRRVLYRVEPEAPPLRAVVLVQSDVRPIWSAEVRERLGPRTRIEEKEWEPALAAGQQLQFRLRANPTVKRPPAEGEESRRHGLFREEEQREWLRRKLNAAGAQPVSLDLMPEGNVVGFKAPAGENGPRRRLTFLSVRFEGRLQVTDPAALAEAVANGIGSAKGFGFGLLSLAPLR
jgi:CRISPR system Cascade subunit CasE